MICVHDFPLGEVSVQVGVMEFGLNTARELVGAVHVGTVQGAVTHAVHWLRSLSATEHYRRLVDNRQYADRRDVLRAVCRTYDHRHTVLRHIQATLPRKGSALLTNTVHSNVATDQNGPYSIKKELHHFS